MRPAMVHWWKHGRHGSHRGAYAGCGPGVSFERREPRAAGEEFQAAFGGGAFGVRRPLRFLAFKLGLEETQVSELAKILDELKTERAQAAVDDRRALALLAESAQGGTFDAAKAAEAAALRVKGEERLQHKVGESLARMHALLDEEQRGKLAYLLRTGTLVM